VKLRLEERLASLREDPAAWVRGIGVKPGMKLADLGAGRGFYSLFAARQVGPAGAVFSVEPDPARAELIEERARREGLVNIRVIRSGAESIDGVPDGSLDFALSRNSLHHFVDIALALEEARRVLAPGGTLYVRDILKGRLLRHGTTETGVERLRQSRFREMKLERTRGRLVARFTK
jgi:ubiquinone/menaquinone biosynthesis C-methylase UbiE